MKTSNFRGAFTIIELLIVIAIIATVSVFSFGYFSDFSIKQSMSEDLSNIRQDIKDLDFQVRDMKIYDYKMIFTTGSLAQISYTNFANQNTSRLLDFSSTSLTGTLSTTGISQIGTSFSMIGYADSKKYFDYTIDALDKQTIDFSNFSKFEVNSSISGATVNDIFLNYYSVADSFTGTNDSGKLVLTDINTKEDKTGISLSQVSIENINNKKFIKDQSGQIIDKAFLFFQRSGKELSLEVK